MSDEDFPRFGTGTHDRPADRVREPTGFGRLARRITRRTTDLLAIGLVAVAGLGLGGQLIDWWRTDPREVASPGAEERPLAGSPRVFGENRPVSLEFGDSPWSIQRQSFAGDRKQAASRLVEECRRIVGTAEPLSDTPESAELGLLNAVKTMPPAEHEPGQWRIYRQDGPLTLAVGVREVSAGGSRTENARGTPSAGKNRPDAHGRVVCWGLVFPQGEKLWTLYLFRPAPDEPAGPDRPQIPLPKRTRRTLALRGGSGTIVGFEGDGPRARWIRFYRNWFDKHGWRMSGNRRSSEEAWTARYVRPAGSAERRCRVDLQFTRADRGTWAGILNIRCATADSVERDRP